jgi:hypothetical protein
MKTLFIALSLSLVTATVCHAEDGRIEQKIQASPRGAVRIQNTAGLVQVTGWNRSEVEVKGRYWGSVDKVDVYSDQGRVVVKVNYVHGSRNGGADLEIRVPEGSDVDIGAVSADVETSKVNGRLHVNTVSGRIRADFARDFEGKTISGDIRLRGESKEGDIRVSTISGDVVVERAGGEVDAETTSGDLFLDVKDGMRVRTRTTSGDLSLSGSLGRDGSLIAESVSGDVTVRVKPAAGFDYEAITYSGDVGNCFGETAERTSRHGPGKRLSGTRGDGQGRVRLKALSGDVAICDR